MRINSAPYVVDLAKSQAVRREQPEAAPAQAPRQPSRVRTLDRVEISPKARELERLKKDLAALPDVRLDQVALAKQNLQYGKYRVDPTVLAHKMLESYDANVTGEAL
jgi:negative regulator of flagellin synthesis FlgM